MSCFGLIGTITYDVISNEEGKIHEGLGGVLHQAAVLCGLEQQVNLYTNLGRELEAEVQELTKEWPTFYREGIHVVSGPGHRVFLYYPHQGERIEVLETEVPPVIPDRILQDLPRLDFLLMVLNSGFDMTLRDWQRVKENAVCPIWLDIHSLPLEKKIGRPRKYVLVRDWKDWVEGIDYLQANKTEVAALLGCPGKNPTREDLASFGVMVCEMGLKAVFITLGAEGALVVGKKGPRDMAAIEGKSVVDTTGCGDVFCAGTAVSLSKGHDPYESALYGMEIASATARLSGISQIFKLMIP
jgi:sugar/nucleoside kinase (ribokinase family)